MPPEEKEDSPLKQIRTFQGDVVDALKSQNESLYSIRQKEGTMAVEEATGPKKVLLLHQVQLDNNHEHFLLLFGVPNSTILQHNLV